jgi:tRNA threonylcarbamoyl adenosine modification protein YeaZ
MPEPMILAFDTSAAHCAAALLSGDRVLTARAEEMGRGQAERLMPMLDEMLSEQRVIWSDLTAIGVGVGPGNFTGVRISVAAARGLALALGVPAIGVSGFDARALDGPAPPFWVAIGAPREQVYLQRLGAGIGTGSPQLRPEADLGALDAPLIHLKDISADRLAANIAHVTRQRWRQPLPRPAPLYLRSADAAPSRDTAPAILE